MAYEERHGWMVERGVTCVSCPGCGFTFDADHEDVDGGYSCPCCSYAELACVCDTRGDDQCRSGAHVHPPAPGIGGEGDGS